MSKWYNDIWNSLKRGEEGLSFRKIATFWSVAIVATRITYTHTTDTNVLRMVALWLIFACVCLGLITIPELLTKLSEIKNGKAPEKSEA
jgi:hypothetical protein